MWSNILKVEGEVRWRFRANIVAVVNNREQVSVMSSGDMETHQRVRECEHTRGESAHKWVSPLLSLENVFRLIATALSLINDWIILACHGGKNRTSMHPLLRHLS